MSIVGVKSKIVDNVAVIYPGPYLNQLRGEGIERECLGLLDAGMRNLVINFGETELINSIGISILLGVVEAVTDASGSLILSNLSDSNRELFEVLGLVSHVRIAASEESALAELSKTATPAGI